MSARANESMYASLNAQIDEFFKTKSNKSECARHLIKKNRLKNATETGLRLYITRYLVDPQFAKNVKENNLSSTPIIGDVIDLRPRLKELLRKKSVYTLEELSDVFNVGIGKIKQAVDELREGGHTIKHENGYVVQSNTVEKSENTTLSIKKMSTGYFKFGAIGDNHLCSKYSRLDVLNALYDLYEAEGVTVVYNTGNWIDGEAKFNKHDLMVHGMDNQIDYFIQNYPKRKNIKTYFVAGDDHEGWYTQREGIDIGKYAEIKAKECGRDDLIYLGYMEADVEIPAKHGKTIIRVLHPGGGSSYAISYTIQKIVESFQGGEKPHVLLAGHYHKADYVFTREVHCIQTGTTQDQSPFMRKKKLAAHLGGWIIEMQTDDNGVVTRFKQEFMPFYDRGYYNHNQKWSYKWK